MHGLTRLRSCNKKRQNVESVPPWLQNSSRISEFRQIEPTHLSSVAIRFASQDMGQIELQTPLQAPE